MIDIGKTIYYLLASDPSVTGHTSNIFPLIIPEKTPLPVIVYERSAGVDYTKFGLVNFNNSIDITVISDSYSTSIDLSKAIYNRLNGYQGEVNNTNIIESRLTNINETFAEDSFIQKMTYSVKAS